MNSRNIANSVIIKTDISLLIYSKEMDLIKLARLATSNIEKVVRLTRNIYECTVHIGETDVWKENSTWLQVACDSQCSEGQSFSKTQNKLHQCCSCMEYFSNLVQIPGEPEIRLVWVQKDVDLWQMLILLIVTALFQVDLLRSASGN